jgi:hypothetical protein
MRELRKGQIYWKRPLVEADRDLVVRHWPHYDLPTAAGKCVDDLSVAALAAVLTAREIEESVRLANELLSSESAELRIVFTMPWKDSRPPPTVADGTPLVMTIPAQVIASEDQNALENSEDKDALDWSGRIVIIGGSEDLTGQDIHQTPVGPMPGAMIIANAIHSIHQFGAVDDLSPLGKLGWALVPIVVVSIVLVCMHGRSLAIPTALAALLGVAMLESYLSLVQQILPVVWVDATIPSIGVIVHSWFED